MLYIIKNPVGYSAEDIENIYNKLPEFRKIKADSYKVITDRRNSILAYYLLEKALKCEYKIAEEITFVYNEHGKPFLKEHPDIYFCISHCNQGIACAVSDSEIGVDIEEYRKVKDSVLNLVCNADQKEEILNSKTPKKDFIMLWTAKESVAKMTGKGLNSQIKDLNTDKVKTYIFDKFCVSVCENTK